MPVSSEVGDSGDETELVNPSRRSRPYRERNASSLLCKLPDELLAHILQSAQGRLSHDFGIRFNLKWRHIMLVCLRLRTVALQCPALWASVDFEWPKRWRELCVRRAASHALWFKAEISTPEEAVDAGRLLPRIQNAFIKVSYTPFDNTADLPILMNKMIQNPASVLQVMDMKTISHDSWKLTSRFCAGQCQKLTLLRLHAVDVHSIPTLPVLRILTINGFCLPSHISHMIQFFANLPQLEQLAMRDHSSSRDRLRIQASPHVQPTALGRLQSISLTASPEDVLAILCCLTLPNTLRNVRVISISDGEDRDTVRMEAVADTVKYLQRYWSSKEGHDDLPVRIVSYRLSQELPAGFDIELSGESSKSPLDRIHFSTDNHIVSAEDPVIQSMLQSTSEISIFVKDPGTAMLGLDRWAVMKQVPALARLVVTATDPSVFMEELQAWSDRRALSGYPTVKMKLERDRGHAWLD